MIITGCYSSGTHIIHYLFTCRIILVLLLFWDNVYIHYQSLTRKGVVHLYVAPVLAINTGHGKAPFQ